MKKTPKLNPFELHINKNKFSVLGQRNKNDRGLPGVARAKAIKKRKETLLQEYRLQNRSNKVEDRRIAEKTNQVSSEDKIMARFAAIKRKAHKKSKFNLADDEILTHKGQTLADIEKFEEVRSDDSDDENSGELGANFVDQAHFGGGMLKRTDKEGAKTHKKLIDELIAESKKRKIEKQQINEATYELTTKLDNEWKDLLPLVNKSQTKGDSQKPSLDDYDKVMRELRFEARGTVSDRLKTEEEVDNENKKRTEELEIQRQVRMEEVNINSKINHRSADDLDDEIYEADSEFTLSYNSGVPNAEIDAQLNGKSIGEENLHNEVAEEEECDESEDLETDSEDDLSDLKGSDSDEVNETENEDEHSHNLEDMKNRNKMEMLDISCLPSSYDEFQSLLKEYSASQQKLIIQKIMESDAFSSNETKKENVSTVFKYLLQYLNDSVLQNSIIYGFEVYASLSSSIYKLAHLDPLNAYKSIKEVLSEKHEHFKKSSKKKLSLENLIFFKLVSLLFPTSDFRHPVVTPTFLFMEQILNTSRIKSGGDIAYGLFLATLILEYTTLSKRYFPSVINYLGGLLHMAVPKFRVKLFKVIPPFSATCNLLVLTDDCSKEDIALKMNIADLLAHELDNSLKIRMIYTVLKLIEEYAIQIQLLPSSVEIFRSATIYLDLLPTRYYPYNVQSQFDKVVTLFDTLRTNKNLDYIVTAAQKPKGLRLYTPKIEEIFEYKRRKFHSKEKAEKEKLVHKLKKETKAALREIRRDNAFLGRVKMQQRIQSDNERLMKVKRIYSEASIQQRDLNALDRSKKKHT